MDSKPSNGSVAELQSLFSEISKDNNDFKQVAQKQKIVSLFGGKPLVFSDQVSKINQNNWSQSRTLVIT